MNKKISLGAAIAFCLIVVAATLSAALIFSMRAYNSRLYNLPERERMYDKVAEVDDQVRQNYIGAVTETELRDSLARGYLEGIGDEYAEYYSAAEYQRLQEDYTSQSVQIGIVTRMDESGYMLITQVYPDSPAQAAGIQAGDLIVRIDDEDITAENYAETASRLYGEAGTTLTIILRRGVEDTSMEMTRRFVEVPTVQGTMLENQVGLVQIQEFNNVTPDQFTRMVDGMIDSGAQALIFDVRGVNSATLYSVAQTLDRLVPEGTLASSTDKNGETTVLEYSDERQVNLPMAVLVDGRTEGEAELFAADIREFGKGSIVGTQTTGKGTIQTLIPLNDGSAIRLTTARINSAGGASYDGVGVKPDFEVPLETGERAQLASDTGEVDPTLLVESDPQLRRAAALGAGGNIGRALELAGSAKPSKAAADAAALVRALAQGGRYEALRLLAGYEKDRAGLGQMLELAREAFALAALGREPGEGVQLTPAAAARAAQAVGQAAVRAKQNGSIPLLAARLVETVKSAL